MDDVIYVEGGIAVLRITKLIASKVDILIKIISAETRETWTDELLTTSVQYSSITVLNCYLFKEK